MFAGEAWFDPIEAGIRGRIRGFIEELLEQELGLWRTEQSGMDLAMASTAALCANGTELALCTLIPF